MKAINTLILAASVLSLSTLAQAADSPFIGLSYGKTSDTLDKSRELNRNLDRPDANAVISREGTWGVRAGQQNLLGSYDLFLPVASQTKLFGGVSAGITRLTQKSAGYSRDSDTGYAVGFQGGVLQQVAQNTSVELGYRYLRSNARTEMSSNGVKQGSLGLDSAGQIYASANYAF